jgi:formate C-acetyltransferase
MRLHRDSPQTLIERTAEVLKIGSGMPYINNDDVLIPAYADLGVSLTDARDYANSNCWETMNEGKSDQELIRGMNFRLFQELALHDGVSSVHGHMGPRPGDPRDFATFEALMAAWKIQSVALPPCLWTGENPETDTRPGPTHRLWD